MNNPLQSSAVIPVSPYPNNDKIVQPTSDQIVTFGHRSGAEQHMRCPRAYYLNYEYLGQGITASPSPLYFAVGTAVHVGLAEMLKGEGLDNCIGLALEFLKGTRAFKLLEQDQQDEQEVLVHGLIYTFIKLAWPAMQQQFEVLCVETGAVEYVPIDSRQYIALQSRPDAILRNKLSGEVAGWSWKTIDDPTDMRRSMFHNDLQGFMEMYYGEKILQTLRGEPVTAEEIASALRIVIEYGLTTPNVTPLDMIHNGRMFLDKLEERAREARDIPTEIDYIQTVFLVKGKRQLLEAAEMPWINSSSYSSDDEEYGGYQPGKIYKQMSHLCYRYRNGEQTEQGPVELYKTGPNKGKPKLIDIHDPKLVDESWAYRFFKPDNTSYSQLSSKWLTSPVRPGQIREWVDRLGAGTVYPSTMNDARNPNPLAKLILFEQPLYRDAAKVLSHVQQQRDRYIQIATDVQQMNVVLATSGAIQSDFIDAMNTYFPQQLISCKSPWKCQFHDFCHSPLESLLDFYNVPDGFEVRQPHHQAETAVRGGG